MPHIALFGRLIIHLPPLTVYKTHESRPRPASETVKRRPGEECRAGTLCWTQASKSPASAALSKASVKYGEARLAVEGGASGHHEPSGSIYKPGALAAVRPAADDDPMQTLSWSIRRALELKSGQPRMMILCRRCLGTSVGVEVRPVADDDPMQMLSWSKDERWSCSAASRGWRFYAHTVLEYKKSALDVVRPAANDEHLQSVLETSVGVVVRTAASDEHMQFVLEYKKSALAVVRPPADDDHMRSQTPSKNERPGTSVGVVVRTAANDEHMQFVLEYKKSTQAVVRPPADDDHMRSQTPSKNERPGYRPTRHG
ncbi:hypothetical protein J6590_063258 [Homalodisca vitripennis]|nr:hypothetical protein J6590_063258 [Homalodisca vitripennis]